MGALFIYLFIFSFRVGIEEEFYDIRKSLHAFYVPYFILFTFSVFSKIKKEDQNTIR